MVGFPEIWPEVGRKLFGFQEVGRKLVGLMWQRGCFFFQVVV